VETATLRHVAIALAATALTPPSWARAQGGAQLEPVSVTAEAPDPPASPGLETVQSDTIDVEEETDETWLTLENVLESTPSVRVRSFGAAGSPSFLSVRGTDATHTLVLLDGVPLNDAATGFVDLSTVPVSTLGSVTVIRGGHAAGTGPYHPGGVVLLETRDLAPGLHGGASVTLGLYPLGPNRAVGDGAGLVLRPAREVLRMGAQRRLNLWQSWFGGSFGILASGSWASSSGDFAYLSDNGTVYDLEDDRFGLRTNNEHDSVSALVKLTWLPDMASQLTLSSIFHSTRDGLPGIDVLPTTRSSLSRSRAHFALSFKRWSDDLMSVPALEGNAFLRLTSIEFVDPLGELALAATHAVSSDFLAGATLSVHDLRRGGSVLGGALEIALEGWRSLDRLGGESVDAVRLDAGLGVDVAVPFGRFAILEASAHASLLHDRLKGTGDSDTRLYLCPRAGLKLMPLAWLHLTTQVAYTHRPPAFMELFGNGGTFRGSPDLRPERGVMADAGLEIALPEAAASNLLLSLRAALFLGTVTDLIVFIQNSQKTMVAQNVDEARLRGLELTSEIGWKGWISVGLGYTLLDPVDRSGIEPYDGLMMPNRPRHDLYLEARVGHFGVEISYLMDNISGGFVDRVNLDPISTRTIHTLGVRWEPTFAKGLSIDLKWWNCGNALVDTSRIRSSTGMSYTRRRAIADVDGYPLPGTALFLTLGFRR
jgi:outer membrane receptor protein involved in Fe transport